jgi:hypothetical protein
LVVAVFKSPIICPLYGRGGWCGDRQINSQFYERTALSKNKTAMLVKGEKPIAGDAVSAKASTMRPPGYFHARHLLIAWRDCL